MALDDYISQEFDPFLKLAQANAVRPPYLDWSAAVSQGTSAQLGAALPGTPWHEGIQPEFFVEEAHGSYLNLNVTSTWDTVTYGLLERDPDLRPVWDHLLGASNPYTAWNDFRRSSDFQPTVETLGLRGRSVLRGARRLFDIGWKFRKAATIFTPTGAALYLAGLARDEIIVSGAKWLWKNRDELAPDWRSNPRPPLRPIDKRVLGFVPDPGIDLGPFAAPMSYNWLAPPTNAVPNMLLSIGGLYR